MMAGSASQFVKYCQVGSKAQVEAALDAGQLVKFQIKGIWTLPDSALKSPLKAQKIQHRGNDLKILGCFQLNFVE